ncbi:winged helix-turn-helix domain-containing protein [Microbacterium paraoxydans]|uniref:winged helix-turn-helix domain-containing protein n=1 Tax=Microbacterium paraoxydans TaxID=199592 RepID=UPI000468435B|nr:winged helix-turn-helix domain-containing protein [Microbacterium paraoxydans]
MAERDALAIEDVQRALGLSPVRVGIIRAAARGPVTAQDLMAELNVSRATLAPHTEALLAAGILVQQKDPTRAGARAGFNRLIWSVDRAVLADHLAALSQSFPAGE